MRRQLKCDEWLGPDLVVSVPVTTYVISIVMNTTLIKGHEQ